MCLLLQGRQFAQQRVAYVLLQCFSGVVCSSSVCTRQVPEQYQRVGWMDEALDTTFPVGDPAAFLMGAPPPSAWGPRRLTHASCLALLRQLVDLEEGPFLFLRSFFCL